MSKAAELAALIGTGASTSKRNMLMNGDMRVSQRNGTSAVTVSASAGAYTLDRWQLYTNSGNYSVQQITDTTLPSGFLNAAKITVSSVGNTSGSGNAVHFEQKIEANNISHLNWGGGNAGTARTCTLSFFVKSSVTGTYSVHFGNDNDRFYVSTYAISSADTWEKKTITVTGPTDGTWNTGTGRGLEIVWVLLQGSGGTTSSLNQWISTSQTFASTSTTQWGTNSGATFFLTGCQFEIAGVAQPFEHESYGDNLARCQRYALRVPSLAGTATYGAISNGYAYDNNTALTAIPLPVEMRAIPAVTKLGSLRAFNPANDDTDISGIAIDSVRTNPSTCYIDCSTTDTNLTAGEGVIISRDNDADGGILISAEL